MVELKLKSAEYVQIILIILIIFKKMGEQQI